MFDFQILFQQVRAGSSYANRTQSLTSAVTRGVDHATLQIDKINASTISTCLFATWTVEQGMDGETWSILVFDQFI